ncbi:hypothetical protein KCP73_22630 [Salmonella enterica subsp. enterica]|nr:hypothetical protein KCP73_22630 [Salmonella enterica subsp. enterica]
MKTLAAAERLTAHKNAVTLRVKRPQRSAMSTENTSASLTSAREMRPQPRYRIIVCPPSGRGNGDVPAERE